MNEQPSSLPDVNSEQESTEENVQQSSVVEPQSESTDKTEIKDEEQNNSNASQSNEGSMGGGQQTAQGHDNILTQNIDSSTKTENIDNSTKTNSIDQSTKIDQSIKTDIDKSSTKIDNIYITVKEKIEEIKNSTDLLREFGGRLPQDQSGKDEEETFSDPTIPLPPKTSKSINLESEKLPIYTQKLKQENLLVISCFNQDVLLSFVYALANNIESLKDKRLLSFEGKNSKRSDDLSIELLAESEQIGKGSDTLIVIDAVRNQTFWDSLIVYRSLTASSIKQNLKNQDRYLICLADPEILAQNLQRKNPEDLFFDYWEIPFLPYILKSEFFSKADEFEEKINAQRKRGLWGDSDREFYELVYGFIKNDELSSEIEKRENLNKNADKQEIEEKLKSIRASDLFKDDEIIEKTVLYVATFFPNLSPNDFFRIVSLLLGNQTITVSIKSEKITKKGNIKEIEIKEQKLAQKLWEESSDKIQKKCKLKSLKFKESTRVIDFSLPYLRKEIKEYLEEEYSMFLQQKFKAIQELGLLFDTSLKVTENVIRLYTDMAVSYPEDYGDDWLVKIILQLTQRIESHTKSDINSTDTPEQIFSKILEMTYYQQIVYIRMSDLIREMLNYPELKDMVDSFLQQLISWKRHRDVLAIVKRLRFAPEFDELYWIRLLLESGDEDTRSQAYKFLYNQAKQSSFRIYEFLDKIQTWLPEPNREKNYSQANKSALQLFIEYCIETTDKIKIEDYGKWPSKHPFFAVFSRQDNKDHLDTLVTWLFYPALKNSYFDLDVINFIGTLLVEWLTILSGFNKDNANDEAIQIMNKLLKKVVSFTTVNEQRKIINFWENLKDKLFDAMDSLENFLDKNSSEDTFKTLETDINLINRRRQIVKNLIKTFKTLQIEAKHQAT